MASRADIDEPAAARARELPGTGHCQVGVSTAGHHDGRKRKQFIRNRREIFELLGSIFAVYVRRRHQQRAFDLVHVGGRRLAPVRQSNTAQAMRRKNNWRRRLFLRRIAWAVLLWRTGARRLPPTCTRSKARCWWRLLT